MNISTAKKIVLGATVGLVTVVSLVAPASAQRRHHGHNYHNNHFRHWHGPAYVTNGYAYDSCGYFYRKWKYTGSGYWKHKYFACID